MKFLVMGRVGAAPIPPQQGAAIMQAAKEWMNAAIAEGRADCQYIVAGGQAGFTISNADSHEELMAQLLSYPLYPFLTWEVTPLCDWTQTYDQFIEFWKKLASQMS